MTTQQLTPLRQRMLDDMKLRNMADGTRRSYVRSVADFSAFHGRSPDELTLEDVRDYQLHLVARGLKASSICPIMQRLALPLRRHPRPARAGRPHPAPAQGRPLAGHPLPGRGRAPAGRRRRPLDARAADHRSTPPACASPRPWRSRSTDIDSGRMTIRVREGKGGRDRYVMLSPQLLAILRAHWRRTRSRPWLFPGPDPSRPITVAHGAARLPRGGRGRRARQVGHRPHPAPLLRHPPAGARGRHPGDPGPARATGISPRPPATPGSRSAPSARCRARSSC